MADKKKGIIATIRDRWSQFKKAGERKKEGKPPVDTGRVQRGPVRPKPNPEQMRAVRKAERDHKRRQRRPK